LPYKETHKFIFQNPMHVIMNNENAIQVAKIERVKVKNITYIVCTSICAIVATYTLLITNLVTPFYKLK
jgi:hypothetical protein